MNAVIVVTTVVAGRQLNEAIDLPGVIGTYTMSIEVADINEDGI